MCHNKVDVVWFIFYEYSRLLYCSIFELREQLYNHHCLPSVYLSTVFQKVSTKPLLRPGWRQVVVQWSTNSCTCVNWVYGVVQIGPFRHVKAWVLQLPRLLFKNYTSFLLRQHPCFNNIQQPVTLSLKKRKVFYIDNEVGWWLL